jgi:hypothetical protein
MSPDEQQAAEPLRFSITVGQLGELTATPAGEQAVHAWQATNAAVLHLALSTLSAPQRQALTAAVPALTALATAVDRLADSPPEPPRRHGPAP